MLTVKYYYCYKYFSATPLSEQRWRDEKREEGERKTDRRKSTRKDREIRETRQINHTDSEGVSSEVINRSDEEVDNSKATKLFVIRERTTIIAKTILILYENNWVE